MCETPLNIASLVEVSRLYYEHQFSQQQIADKLGISRPVVSRLLTQARDEGIVRIEIVDPRKNGSALEMELRECFGLQDVVLVPAESADESTLKKRLGKAAARYLDLVIRDDLTLGVAWGSTVREIARQLPSRPVHNMTVVQIVGGISRSERDTHASESAIKIGEKYQAVPYLLPLPAIVDSPEVRQTIMADKNISRVLELGRQAEVVVFSVGRFDHESILVQSEYFEHEQVDELVKAGAVGDICSRVITATGEICSKELDHRTIGIELKELRKKKLSIVVAGGSNKFAVILAGLRGKYFNVLVTDDAVARRLLAQS